MRGQIARGAAWMLLFRAAEKSLGLISTVVLARLLVPEDFGLVAMAMSVIALVELASAFSFELVLIQKHNPTRSDYDTVWTLNLLFAVGCALAMAALAVPAAHFYSDPRLVAVIWVVALGWCVQGMENVGVVDFRRSMNFRREFQFLALKKVAAFAVTVTLALALRNYWALVLGSLAGRVAGTSGSFVMSNYRPRLALGSRSDLFKFSSWLLLANAVGFVETRFSHFFVGRVQGPAPLGMFTIGADLANIPTYEVSAPINRAAFPGYSRLVNQPELLRENVATVIGFIALITVPMAAGVVGLSDALIGVVLGDRWLPVAPILDTLVVGACVRSIMSNYHSAFLALGRPHLTPVLEAGRVALMVPLTVWWSGRLGLQGVALAQTVSIGLGFVCSTVVLVNVLKLRATRLLAQLARPALASVAMLLAIHTGLIVLRRHGLASAGPHLIAGIVLGAVSFPVTLGAIWWLCGRPAGAEQAVLTWIKQRLRQHLGGVGTTGPA